MQKNVDLTKLIIPTKTERVGFLNRLKSDINTTDNVYLPSYNEVKKLSSNKRYKCYTDFALLNNASTSAPSIDVGQQIGGAYWLRSSHDNVCNTVDNMGECYGMYYVRNGVAPCLNLKITDDLTIDDIKNNVVIKNEYGVNLHILKLGKYPKSFVSSNLNTKLENLYNNGDLKTGLKATGKWYTGNGALGYIDFAGKYSPEFKYNGETYVRVMPNLNTTIIDEDGRFFEPDKPRWVKVEPINFNIKNYKQVISGRAKTLKLEANDIIIAGLPFNCMASNEYDNRWKSSLIRAFLNSSTWNELCPDVNHRVIHYDFSRTGFLNEALNPTRKPIETYTIPEFEGEICDNAFNGCVTLKKLILHNGIKRIGKNAFDGCKFKYMYTTFSQKNVFCDELPDSIKDTHLWVDLNKINNSFKNFDYNFLLDNVEFYKITKLTEKLGKQKFAIPFEYVKEMNKYNLLNLLINDSDFRYFKNEVPSIYKFLDGANYIATCRVMNFARAIGCFSNRPIFDKNGNPTNVIMAQKASSLFAQILKNNVLSLEDFTVMFDTVKYDQQPDQEFLDFLIKQNKENNLQTIIELEKGQCKGLFARLFNDFETAQKFKNTIDEHGKPIVLSWKNALIKYNAFSVYKNINEENKDIAELYSSMGLSQSVFNMASNLRKVAKNMKTPHHILGKPLKEESVLDKIEGVKQNTKDLLIKAKNNLQSVYNEQFTYEMLDKADPQNAIIGLLCDCCATINSEHYGKIIAKSTVTSEYVQNLVVRDGAGKIIAKGAMYVNKQYGYIVINDFEMNEKYRKNENFGSGFYDDSPNDINTQNRQKIFDAFMRGLNAFIKEYDKQNPNNPIKQANVGIGYNRLKAQCEGFCDTEDFLDVPDGFAFNDAAFEQHILYKRDNSKVHKREGHWDKSRES